MNKNKLLAFFMSVVMIFSICSPTMVAFADELENQEIVEQIEETKETVIEEVVEETTEEIVEETTEEIVEETTEEIVEETTEETVEKTTEEVVEETTEETVEETTEESENDGFGFTSFALFDEPAPQAEAKPQSQNVVPALIDETSSLSSTSSDGTVTMKTSRGENKVIYTGKNVLTVKTSLLGTTGEFNFNKYILNFIKALFPVVGDWISGNLLPTEIPSSAYTMTIRKGDGEPYVGTEIVDVGHYVVTIKLNDGDQSPYYFDSAIKNGYKETKSSEVTVEFDVEKATVKVHNLSGNDTTYNRLPQAPVAFLMNGLVPVGVDLTNIAALMRSLTSGNLTEDTIRIILDSIRDAINAVKNPLYTVKYFNEDDVEVLVPYEVGKYKVKFIINDKEHYQFDKDKYEESFIYEIKPAVLTLDINYNGERVGLEHTEAYTGEVMYPTLDLTYQIKLIDIDSLDFINGLLALVGIDLPLDGLMNPITVKADDKNLIEGFNYIVTPALSTLWKVNGTEVRLPVQNVGTYTKDVRIVDNNYTFAEGEKTATATFIVEKAKLKAVAVPESLVYSGERQTPSVKLIVVDSEGNPTGKVLSSGFGISWNNEYRLNVGKYNGTAYLRPIATVNYEFAEEGNKVSYQITPATVMVTVPEDRTYDTTPIAPALVEGIKPIDRTSYKVEYYKYDKVNGEKVGEALPGAPKDAGVYTAVVKFLNAIDENNYEVFYTNADEVFEIFPATVTVTMPAERVYDGTAVDATVECDLPLDSTSLVVDYYKYDLKNDDYDYVTGILDGAPKDAGVYAVYVHFTDELDKNNYTVVPEATLFKILQRTVDFKWSGSTNFVQGTNKAAWPKDATGFVGDDMFTVLVNGKVKTKRPTSAGKYIISVVLPSDNYVWAEGVETEMTVKITEPPVTPDTGDTFSRTAYIALVAASSFGIAVLSSKMRKKNED